MTNHACATCSPKQSRYARRISLLSLAGLHLLLLPVSSASLAAPAPAVATSQELFGEAIFDWRGRHIAKAKLIAVLQNADIVMIGEQHDNTRHHVIQAALLHALAQAGFRSIAFEMLDDGHQQALDTFLGKGKTSHILTTAQLGQMLAWEARGWPTWPVYAPLFSIARSHNLRIIAAGLDNDLARNVSRFGPLALPRRMRNDLSPALKGTPAVDMAGLELVTMRAHGLGEASAEARRLAVAQYVKDAWMAHSIVPARGKVVLIAGNTHARNDVGVPAHIRRLAPGRRIVSIRLIQNTPASGPAQALPAVASPSGPRRHDYLWFTAGSAIDGASNNREMSASPK